MLGSQEEQLIDATTYCDNCNQPIIGKAKYVWKNGLRILVHASYNKQTKKCNEPSDL